MSHIPTSMLALVTRVRTFESELAVALVVLVVAYFALAAWRSYHDNLPPGPYGLPVVGYLPFLSKNAHLDFQKLGEKYGPVFRVKMGSANVYVVHDVELIKEALLTPQLLGRPRSGAFTLFNKDGTFFVDPGQHKWREQRRFVVQSMKNLGLGKTQIEGDIMDEIHHFLSILRSHNGQPTDVKEPLSSSLSNNICSLVFGKRYEHGDPERKFLDNVVEAIVEFISQTSAVSFFPWLLKIPLVPKLMNVEKGTTAITDLKAFSRKVTMKHRESYDPKHVRDFIDSYITEQDLKKSKYPNTTFTDDTLVANVMDLFVAGSETTRTSILWILYTAAAFPDHQDRIREEILEIIGPDRDPEYQDIRSMPFTHSFILEVLRWKTIAPLNAPHCTLRDVTLNGYRIPEDSNVMFNLFNAHHNPDYWKEPDTFLPDRFVTDDGKSVSRPAHYMPFSMGKRVCPGEPMAMMEMFLYLSSIVQKFRVIFPEGYEPTFDAALTGTYRLEPYTIRFVPRN